MIDINIFTGIYPFRNLPSTCGKKLTELLDEIECQRCIATAFPSIFYKDCLDGLKLTAAQTESCGKRVFFYAVMNPGFPGCIEDMNEALKLPGVAGIRLFPRLHHYELMSPQLRPLMAFAAERDIPVNLAARLVDDRLNHWMLDIRPPLPLYEIGAFIKSYRKTKIILSMFYHHEIAELVDDINSSPNVFVDIGVTKPDLFWYERIVEKIDSTRLLFGTGAPLYYHGSSLLSLEKANIFSDVKQQILQKNAERVFVFGK